MILGLNENVSICPVRLNINYFTRMIPV